MEYAPHHICTYLYQLAQAFNTFYNKHQISDNKLRLQITKVTAETLKKGLGLLGIEAPARM